MIRRYITYLVVVSVGDINKSLLVSDILDKIKSIFFPYGHHTCMVTHTKVHQKGNFPSPATLFILSGFGLAHSHQRKKKLKIKKELAYSPQRDNNNNNNNNKRTSTFFF